ncbi:macro domain-containing protein [Spirochaetia bacterium]|nr:macro domain-containing protein [Spirochaetia bacterium]
MAEIEVVLGDITKQKVDAVVNAANTGMLGGGGVDGAIHRAAGKLLLEECLKVPDGPKGRCPTGEARITGAGALPCKYVIHTAGPVYHGGKSGEKELLSSCYRNCLLLAQEHGVTSIAFPNISTGVYGYPKESAAETAVATVIETLKKAPAVRKVIFTCFDSENYALYEKAVR